MSVRFIIAGGRDFDDRSAFDVVLEGIRPTICGYTHIEIATGECPSGADKLGREWAMRNEIKYVPLPADWDRYGRGAGAMRNRTMAAWAAGGWNFGTLIAFWDGKSRGTKNMIEEALKAGLEIHVIRYGRCVQ